MPAPRTPRVRALTERTGFLLIELGKAVLASADEALAPLGLAGRHLHVLTFAAGGPMSQQQLVEGTGVDRTTMVGILDDLERLSLAERRRDPDDRRRHLVTATANGRTLLQEADRVIEAAEGRLFASLSPAERTQLHQLADRVLRDLGEPPCGPAADSC